MPHVDTASSSSSAGVELRKRLDSVGTPDDNNATTASQTSHNHAEPFYSWLASCWHDFVYQEITSISTATVIVLAIHAFCLYLIYRAHASTDPAAVNYNLAGDW
ncbi:unnamed protein product [Amoebophrya sp. A25]|nr:unnamed protein product [Amoebophrya sp. A25]|eukprot:GSA25T00020655001.1